MLSDGNKAWLAQADFSENLLHQLREPWGDPPGFSFYGMKLHDHTAATLDLISPLPEGIVPQAMHVYTDGPALRAVAKTGCRAESDDVEYAPRSTHDVYKSAAEAMAILWEHDGKMYFGGFYFQRLATDVPQSSIQAEASALYTATRFALQVQYPLERVHFWFDSTVVGHAVAGRTGDDNLPVDVPLARGIARILATRTSVGFHHVYAHQGDPWNELVDVAAKTAAYHQLAHPAPMPPTAYTNSKHAARWLWLWAMAPEERIRLGFPEVYNNQVMFPHPHWTPAPDRSCYDFEFMQEECSDQDAIMHLRLATINTRCLDKATNQLRGMNEVAGRTELIRHQLMDLHIDITGLQETHSRTCEFIDSPTHFRYTQGPQGGHPYGDTEIWVSKSMKVPSVNGPIFVTNDHISTLAHHPRFMMLAIRVPGFTLHVLSLQRLPPSEAAALLTVFARKARLSVRTADLNSLVEDWN